MQRILVIGSGGAGKTTVAREIARRLDLPLIHLDAHYWRPGWIETPKEEWRRVVEGLIAQPRWVMDGNYGGTMDLRIAASDTVVFLDLPRLVCLWRVLKRTTRFWGTTRPEITAGNPERMTWDFVKWIWTYPKRRRPALLAKLNMLDDKRVIVLSSQREVDQFLRASEEAQ